jgi:hypothetical protein
MALIASTTSESEVPALNTKADALSAPASIFVSFSVMASVVFVMLPGHQIMSVQG